MFTRVVDGLAIWTSKKLTKVSEKYRAEYANLIPFSNVYGYFEYDIDLIWSRIYSYNRPDFTREAVREMLEQFVAAEMISLHELKGRTYGYFVGIEKEGRLPALSRRERYKDNYPSPRDFEEYVISK